MISIYLLPDYGTNSLMAIVFYLIFTSLHEENDVFVMMDFKYILNSATLL